MLLHGITACAGVATCIAIAANLWSRLLERVSGDLLRRITVGVVCGFSPHFGTRRFVVPLLITMSTMDRAGITHLFSLSVKVFSLASDYIIASFGSAVNRYLSFNRRGATAFQVLQPRQLFTSFVRASNIYMLTLTALAFRIVIEYLHYICFTPYISVLYNRTESYFFFLAFFNHRSSVHTGRAEPIGKT